MSGSVPRHKREQGPFILPIAGAQFGQPSNGQRVQRITGAGATTISAAANASAFLSYQRLTAVSSGPGSCTAAAMSRCASRGVWWMSWNRP